MPLGLPSHRRSDLPCPSHRRTFASRRHSYKPSVSEGNPLMSNSMISPGQKLPSGCKAVPFASVSFACSTPLELHQGATVRIQYAVRMLFEQISLVRIRIAVCC